MQQVSYFDSAYYWIVDCFHYVVKVGLILKFSARYRIWVRTFGSWVGEFTDIATYLGSKLSSDLSQCVILDSAYWRGDLIDPFGASLMCGFYVEFYKFEALIFYGVV